MFNFVLIQPIYLPFKKNLIGNIDYRVKQSNKISKSKITFLSKNNESNIQKDGELINTEPEIWEIDFFSKPVLNENGKKIWELIIINNKGTFEHIESVPNNLINSKELRKRINFVINSAKVRPIAVKFFRAQMFNMINIALSEIELNVRPSKKTRLLFEKLKQRDETVYNKMNGFKPFLREIDTVQILKKTSERMPDFLRGDSYIFATIDTASLKDVFTQKPKFLELFQPDVSVKKISSIPGFIIISNRAKSLSSWLNNIELSGVLCDIEKKRFNHRMWFRYTIFVRKNQNRTI